MKRTLILSLAGAASLVASCSFGPLWSPPEMPVPAEFRGNGAAGSTMADLPWQQVLNDKNLEQLLSDVFTSNRSLEAMVHNVNSASRYITIARAPLFPSLSYMAQGSKGASSPASISMATTDTVPGAAGFSASWELDIWGKTRKGLESAEAKALAAEEGMNNLRISLMKQVASGYLRLIMLDEQLKIAHEAVASYRESLKLFENQLEGGVADRLQTASAQAALSSAEAQIPNLEMQIAEMENTLSVLAGRAPGPIARSGSMQAFAKASGVAAGIPAEVIARRPDIRAAEQNLRAANAEIGVAIASYFPSISLTGLAGVAAPDLCHGLAGSETGWGIGASLTGPLFNAGSLRANEQMKRDAFLAAKADYEQTVLAALAEISTTLTQRTKLLSIMKKQEAAVAAYQESMKLSKARYAQGLASYYEVLTAQQGLFPAQTQLAAYRYQYAACVPTLYTQLGGGWQNK
ncbi:MAG: efflux transporter outer membrane subunit [Akkermansia sp.]|nr:efflux transporter outer membrane subunit [Akkermansia sp.]MBR5331580.1 efflux transporter outer membrane subunit [Akkermansia sp.]